MSALGLDFGLGRVRFDPSDLAALREYDDAMLADEYGPMALTRRASEQWIDAARVEVLARERKCLVGARFVLDVAQRTSSALDRKKLDAFLAEHGAVYGSFTVPRVSAMVLWRER